MLYLVAIISPPLALLFTRKWGQFLISTLIMLFALVGLFFAVLPGVVLWLVAVIHAVLVVQNRNAEARNQKLVDAVSSQRSSS